MVYMPLRQQIVQGTQLHVLEEDINLETKQIGIVAITKPLFLYFYLVGFCLIHFAHVRNYGYGRSFVQ